MWKFIWLQGCHLRSSKYVHFQMLRRSRSSLDLAMEIFEEEQSQAVGEEPSDEGLDEQGEQDPQSEEEPEEGQERQGAQHPEREEEPEEGKMFQRSRSSLDLTMDMDEEEQ